MDLKSAAEQLNRFFGLTVIPSDRKRPLLEWKKYQTRTVKPSLIDWNGKYQLGMVLQPGWIVVDLDDAANVELFQQQLPHLWDTTRETTPRGMHLYYRTETTTGTKHLESADILQNSFVVCWPSRGYEMTWDQPLTLTESDLDEIVTLLSSSGSELPAHDNTIGDSVPDDGGNAGHIRAAQIVDIYTRHYAKIGRNNTAFFLSRKGRDSGLDQQTVTDRLAGPFIASRVGSETPEARRRELERTVASAYSRPAMTPQVRTLIRFHAVREKLYRMKDRATAKVLQAVYQNGYAGGETLTRKQIQACAGNVAGDWSRRKAYAATIQGVNVFQQRAESPPHPPIADAVNAGPSVHCKTNAICTEPKPTKTPIGGRPAYIYTVPTVEMLADLLKIQFFDGDEITLQGMSQGKTLGVTMLKALITRLSGRPLPNAWLAAQFGVGISTIQRWKTTGGIVGQNIGFPVTPDNLRYVFPDEGRIEHSWLQVEGKRYPAIKCVWARLWKTGARYITYHERGANVYRIEPEQPVATEPEQPVATEPEQPVATEPVDYSSDGARLDAIFARMAERRARNLREWEEHGKAEFERKQKARRGNRHSRPLPDQHAEQTAQYIHFTLTYKTRDWNDNDRRPHIDMVRQMIAEHGPDAAEQALQTMLAAAYRIKNPVGFWRAMLTKGARHEHPADTSPPHQAD